MAITYGFYDSLSGDRKYNALQLSQLFKGIITDGIFQSIGQGFVVGAPGLMNVSVGSGRGWFNDRWIDNDAAIQLTVLASEAVLNRIDTVAIEIDSSIGVRANSIKVIKGTPASSPVAPTMANTSTLHQYPLADIYIPANDTDITAGQITNRIGMAGGTPLITGILNSYDVSTLFGQFEDNFQVWFANLQSQLDANQASNLQNQINAINSDRQVNFSAYKTVESPNVTGDNTSFIVICDNEMSDRSFSYNPGSGIFTAPISGLYIFSGNILFRQVNVAVHNALDLNIRIASTLNLYEETKLVSGVSDYVINHTAIGYMVAGETARMEATAWGSSKVVDIYGGTGVFHTRFAGALLG